MKFMDVGKMRTFLTKVLDNMPQDWLKLTTHRLDIYNEGLAKTEFLDQLERLFRENKIDLESLNESLAAR